MAILKKLLIHIHYTATDDVSGFVNVAGNFSNKPIIELTANASDAATPSATLSYFANTDI